MNASHLPLPQGVEVISLKGVRQHNLKNFDLDIPRNRLVVITGLSGSGKSSLAFDTLYAEGQRRYVESLSSYVRQFLEMMDKPDVDSIEGLSPAIAIDQKVTSRNPRSTVGTVTEIHDYLRLLFARVGKPHCPICGRLVTPQTVSQMVDQIQALPTGTRFMVLAPTVSGRKGEYRKELARIAREGFTRVRIDGTIVELEETGEIDRKKNHTIEIVIDRLSVRGDNAQRLADSLALGLREGQGRVIIHLPDKPNHGGAGKEDWILSETEACTVCNISLPELSPKLFSFNSPYGACPECLGIGVLMEVDPTLLIPHPDLSLAEGGIKILESRNLVQIRGKVVKFFEERGVKPVTPFSKMDSDTFSELLYGSSSLNRSESFSKSTQTGFDGLVTLLGGLHRSGQIGAWARGELESVLSEKPCPSCHGARLKRESLAVTVGEKNIQEISDLSVRDAYGFFQKIVLTEKEEQIARKILREITGRLSFLKEVGVDYLTLSRSAQTLSGGESQRIRLATQIGAGLTGVLYILDEPSIGLHPRDNKKLLDTLFHLRDLGNSVIVVEHDEETIESADHVIDMGPGAGRMGGEILAQGTPREIMNNPLSVTGAYLSGSKTVSRKPTNRIPKGYLTVVGASEHNLKGIDVSFPLGLLTVVTGVSGSGKSTLVLDVLYNRLARLFYGSRERPGHCREIRGVDRIDKVVNIDQSPIGRTPRSNPATYTGLFTPVRDLYSQVPESRARGYDPGRFSFNVKGGRCEACQGDGVIKIEMHFLPDVYVICDVCRGARYNRETLEIRYRGRTISDILGMTVDDASEFFSAVPAISGKLEMLKEVGLGYIHLGQSATTLSGGEAQRVKLSKELSRRATGNTLYILDEPTTGLHFADIQKLLDTLEALVTAGNTVVVIEHNIDIIANADYLIDLGPEGGDRGGTLLASGSPEEIQAHKDSYTGQALRERLSRRHYPQ
jgi:excinuclease ABC subunit A